VNTKEKLEIVKKAREAMDVCAANISLPHVKKALGAMVPVLDVLDELLRDFPNPPTRKKRGS